MIRTWDHIKTRNPLIIFYDRGLTEKSCSKCRLRMLIDLDRRTFLLDVPTVCNNDLIRHFNGFFLIVGYENTCNAQLFDHFFQPGTKLLPYFCIDGRERLVQKQQVRSRRQCSCKCHPLTLSAGQLTGVPFLQSLQTDEFDQFADTFFRFFFIGFLHIQSKCNVLGYGHIAEQRIVLKHESDASLARRNVVDHFSIDIDLSGIWCLQSGDHTQDRGLTASAGTQQTDQFSLFNGKIHIVGRLIVAICFIYIFQLNVHVTYSFLPRYSITLRMIRITMAMITRMDDTANAGTY